MTVEVIGTIILAGLTILIVIASRLGRRDISQKDILISLGSASLAGGILGLLLTGNVWLTLISAICFPIFAFIVAFPARFGK